MQNQAANLHETIEHQTNSKKNQDEEPKKDNAVRYIKKGDHHDISAGNTTTRILTENKKRITTVDPTKYNSGFRIATPTESLEPLFEDLLKYHLDTDIYQPPSNACFAGSHAPFKPHLLEHHPRLLGKLIS